MLAEYERDGYAGWLYGRALLSRKAMPASLPDYMTFGGETEAVVMVAAYGNAWRRTPGALAWLAQNLS